MDLNYTEDSPGSEWAIREDLPYRSGLEMFKLQADLQRQTFGENFSEKQPIRQTF